MADLTTLFRDLKIEVGEFVAEHAVTSVKEVESLHRFRKDPGGFIRHLWPDFEMYPKQLDVVNVVLKNSRIAVYGGNAGGKDAVVARLILWVIYACDGVVGIIHPTIRQGKGTMFSQELRPAFESAAVTLPGQVFTGALKRPDKPESGAFIAVGSGLSSMSGFHGDHLWFVISEAQGVEDFVWEAAAACATGANNKIIAVGNPIHRGDPFESRCDRWASVQFSAFDHPNIVHGDPTIIPGGPSQSWIDEIRDEWGENSDWYRSHVLGEFPVGDSDTQLISRAALDRAESRYRGAAVRPPGRYVFSLDPSEGRNDSSALCVKKGSSVIEMITWKRAGATETRDRVIAELQRFQCGPPAAQSQFWPGDIRGPADFDLVVDSIAFGAGVADILHEAGLQVHRFKASHSPVNDEHGMFFDSRAQTYWAVRKALEADTLTLPPDPLLREELLAIRWGLNAQEKIQIEKKKAIRTRIGRSTDRADALAMSFAIVRAATGLVSMVDF